MFLNIKTLRIIKKIFIAAFFGVFLFPLMINAQGGVWENIFPGSLSLTANNEEVEIIEYKGDIYAGIGVGGESQVYRYISGDNWEQVNKNAFEIDVERGVASMAVHNGYLYVGDRFDLGGGFVLRTKAQGGPPFTDWTQVNIGGFGDVNNQQISDLKSFGSFLYAATKNSITGTEIWRTQEAGGPPYTDWTQVNLDGFSDVNNVDTPFLGIYDGYLYASTGKSSGAGEVWRTNNGINWSQVQTDGFGNLSNYAMSSFGSFDNSLIVGSANLNGGNLFKTINGTFWSVVNANGFGDTNNKSIFPLLSIGNYLYLGTENNSAGAEIYRTGDGIHFTQINSSGFGDSSYKSFKALENSGNLFINASNSGGGQIWVDYPPIPGNLTASQNINDPNKINITFSADDQNKADNLLARIEYNIGSGWKKATIMVNDAETSATYGDPKVNNSQDFQIGDSLGYITASTGLNTVKTVWDYSVDEPNVNTNNAQLRVKLDDQILESSDITSNQFSITSVLPVSLIKSYSINSPAPAPPADSEDNIFITSAGSLIKNIGGNINKLTPGNIFNINYLFYAYFVLAIILVIFISIYWFLKKQYYYHSKNRLRLSSAVFFLIFNLGLLGIFSLLQPVKYLSASPYDVFPRDIITYRIEYKNSSNQDIHDLYILDEIPQYSTYVAGSMNLNGALITDELDFDSGDFNISNQNKVTFYVGSVGANNSGYVEFRVQVNANAPMGGVIENQARGAFNPGNILITSNIIQNFVVATGSISGKVFYDNNRDGQINSNDWGIENAQVKLYEDRDHNGLLDTAVDYFVDSKSTDQNGDYHFTGLSAQYYLFFVESYSLPSGYILTTGNIPAQAVLTASDQQYQNANFGYFNQPQLPVTPDIPVIPSIPSTFEPIPDNTPDDEQEEPPIIEEEDEEPIEIPDREEPIEPIEQDKPIKIETEDVKPIEIEKPDEPGIEKRNWRDYLTFSLPIFAALSLANLFFSVPFSALANFLYYLFQLITQPFLLLTRERKRELGAVYDSLTKLPLDLALVRLFDKDTGKLVETRVTNSRGQYLFVAEKNKQYYLSVQKENYYFPSKLLEFKPDDDEFKNLYYGGIISTQDLEKNNGKISKNIPLDLERGKSYAAGVRHKTIQTGINQIDDLKSMDEEAKLNEYKKIRKQFTIKKISQIIAYLGPAYGLLVFILNPKLITFIFLIIHILLLLLFMRLAQTRENKSWGKSFDLNTKKGLDNCVVRLFDQQYGKLLFTTLSKSDGRYGFLAGKNNYLISAYRDFYRMPQEKLEIQGRENGIINKDIGLEKK